MNKKTNINFEFTISNHIIIECKVNLIMSRLIIDTGASNSCINYLSAKKLNINFKKYNENASSATSIITDIFHSKNNILEISDYKNQNFEVVLFDMSQINNLLEDKGIKSVDGIIGGDILKKLRAKINYKKNILSLEF